MTWEVSLLIYVLKVFKIDIILLQNLPMAPSGSGVSVGSFYIMNSATLIDTGSSKCVFLVQMSVGRGF